MPPLISICIPTHHGRDWTLDEALRSIRDQGVDGMDELLEVCVSDNASADGTEKVVSRHASEASFPIRYRRNRKDLGTGRNVIQALTMGKGRWRWPLSSDDALLPGALAHVIWLAERNAGAAGISFAARWFDRYLREPIPVPCPGVQVRPSVAEGRIEGLEPMLRTLAMWWCFMSAHLVRGDLWDESSGDDREATIFPHVRGFALAVKRAPSWGWSSAALVASRMDNSSYGRDHEIDRAGVFVNVARDLGRVWRETLPGPLRREVGAAWVRACAPAILAHSGGGWPARTRARVGLALARRAWPDPGFWRQTLPALLRPPASGSETGGSSAGPSDPLPAGELRAGLEADVPALWLSGGGAAVPCRWEHRGNRVLPVADPHPVRLGWRWTDPRTCEIAAQGRTLLPVPLGPGGRVELELPVVAPVSAGRYLLRIAPVQEHVAWFDDVDPASGLAAEVSVELPTAGAVHGALV